jgi:UDPglucose--hexose-1-phosphate uridylyltransferase
MSFDFLRPHRRYNPLLDEWVLVSPHRTQRPWQGKVEQTQPKKVDPSCYLCPNNVRANGERNPDYKTTFVFENDFAAMSPHEHDAELVDDIFHAVQERGLCRVLVYNPNHLAHLADFSHAEMEAVIQMWQNQYLELAVLAWVRWVQIFENRGEMMGASNPHPHGQVWASSSLPDIPARMDSNLRQFYERHRVSLLHHLARVEHDKRERVVFENQDWIVIVPFWAVWPFETMLLPKHPVRHLGELTHGQITSLAQTLPQLVRTYDGLFQTDFPYSMGIYQAPPHQSAEHWGLFWSFAPPLLRSATIRKFMVGYEIFARSQRDITPETAAERLREVFDRIG